MEKNKLVHNFVIGTFVSLYLLVSIISTIHVIDFFKLSNPTWLAVSLAIGFELGAAASLASLIILKKMNKTIVWLLFFVITAMQMQGNMYYAFMNLTDFQGWSELFNLIEEDVLYQKRILAFVSGAILPLVALGFIKSLVDYIKPEEEQEEDKTAFIPSDSVFGDLEDLMTENVADSNEDLQEPEAAEEVVEQEAPIETAEEWDEDHALDLVLNDMVKDIEDNLEDDEFANWSDFEDEEDDEDLIDELPEDVVDEILAGEEFEVEEAPIENKRSIDLFNIASSGASIADAIEAEDQEDDDLLGKALREKGAREMDAYLKNKENDKEATD